MSELTSVVEYAPADIRCAFCEHANPRGARYCNACAADLQLTLCARCDAINNRSASLCHKCGASLIDEQPPAERRVVRMDADATAPQRRRMPILALLIALAAGIALAWWVADQGPNAVPKPLREALPASSRGADQSPQPKSASPEAGGGLPTATASRQHSPATAADRVTSDAPAASAQQPLPTPDPMRTCTEAVAALSLCDRAR